MAVVKAAKIGSKVGAVYNVLLVPTLDITEDGEIVYRFGTDTSFVVNNINIGIVEGQGTPGNPAGGVVTVQGDPLMTPVMIMRSASQIHPANQASVNAETLFAGSVLDALNSQTVVFELTNIDLVNSLDFRVLGGFLANLSDGVEVQAPATLAHGAAGSFVTIAAAWRYYGVFIKSTVPGAPATGQLYGLMKG